MSSMTLNPTGKSVLPPTVSALLLQLAVTALLCGCGAEVGPQGDEGRRAGSSALEQPPTCSGLAAPVVLSTGDYPADIVLRVQQSTGIFEGTVEPLGDAPTSVSGRTLERAKLLRVRVDAVLREEIIYRVPAGQAQFVTSSSAASLAVGDRAFFIVRALGRAELPVMEETQRLDPTRYARFGEDLGLISRYLEQVAAYTRVRAAAWIGTAKVTDVANVREASEGSDARTQPDWWNATATMQMTFCGDAQQVEAQRLNLFFDHNELGPISKELPKLHRGDWGLYITRSVFMGLDLDWNDFYDSPFSFTPEPVYLESKADDVPMNWAQVAVLLRWTRGGQPPMLDLAAGVSE